MSVHRSLIASLFALGLLVIGLIVAMDAFSDARRTPSPRPLSTLANEAEKLPEPSAGRPRFQPRKPFEVGGYMLVSEKIQAWPPGASLEQVSDTWEQAASDAVRDCERLLSSSQNDSNQAFGMRLIRAACWNFEGKPTKALDVLSQLREQTESDSQAAADHLYTLVYLQGLTSLRMGETENCVMCRGESSCILPISPAARHTNETGSRQAIKFFTEYLDKFPDDLEVKWLLNIAHMTLGEHPQGVDPRFLISLDRYQNSEFDLGKFRDVGHLVGLDRLNRQGGGLMDDFDNDGLLDIVTTANAPHESISFYRNKGTGGFANLTSSAGVKGQVTGLYCVQTDYDNDGFLDIFLPRGAWLPHPVRPGLLHNNQNGTFTDVTKEAGLEFPTRSLTAAWADFDNDGLLDLFLPDMHNRLYRNLGDGKFEEVGLKAGVVENADNPAATFAWKCGNWCDYDNDRYPDLFVNNLYGTATLFHNNQNGTFSNVTAAMNVDGPKMGFAVWSWDYDNDGWFDILATSYGDPNHRLKDVILGLLGEPHHNHSSKLYRNLEGKGFQDVTRKAGLDYIFTAMGCNFGDFDNDGYLDFYLGTGDPDLATLVPNRMFKNVAGKRFADISASSGTGHLQKGHSVACGDWDRNGTLDIFIEMGGVTPVDRFHNLLFQNPGNTNNWLNVKLQGTSSNRSAIGARIKVVIAGDSPLTIHREVNSGSSFGANPLEQFIGLGTANSVRTLEVYWPKSGVTQVFNDLAVNQAIEITEGQEGFKPREYKAIALPSEK